MITSFLSVVLLIAAFAAAWCVAAAVSDALVSWFACWIKSEFLEYGC